MVMRDHTESGSVERCDIVEDAFAPCNYSFALPISYEH